MEAVGEISVADAGVVPAEVFDSTEPCIVRGFVEDWPVVQAANQSNEALADYLSQFDAQLPLTVYVGSEDIGGRFFYNDDCSGFNFRSGTATLAQVLGRLLGPAVDDDIDTLYVGSTPVDSWLPGFREANDVSLPVDDALVNFWLGSQTTISAHYDFPDNLACVVAGRRRFTLFPPDQLDNLYVGPIDKTPSGQAISLVDFDAPDLERYPKFADALAAAKVADLLPGDVLFIPSMWWHHVTSSEPVNMLVNYWWCRTPLVMGAPSAALNHAILALRNLPEHQRKAWKHLFDFYVFDSKPESFAHIPAGGRGMLEGLDDETIKRVRAEIAERVK